MAGNIKGLTVEIGGDTTKLGQALENVNKTSRNLSSELGQINRLLKMDPGNTELLAQKHKVLSEAIANTKAKLDTLKEAQAQVQAQFKRGEISEAQYRAFQREIVATENKLSGYENALKETEDAMCGLNESTQKTRVDSSKFGDALKVAAKAGLAAITAAAAAALALGKSVISSYGDYEQLIGGVETLFKESAGTVQEYAANAYRTAGLSANAYMETVTGFSASLIASLGGDTAKAVEYADMAITDMADNANKMGTDITSIQNAYQGFAKQNYTMLDNLKLGYGGTKEEMERLLADAEKLPAAMGREFDISNYADVVEAIHLVQTEMGITGTTALEAEKTISGSISTLKGALKNLVTGLGDANADTSALTGHVISAFKNVLTNITPVINNLVSALPDVLVAVLAAVGDLLPGLLITTSDLISQVIELIVSMLPSVASAVAGSAVQIAAALVSQLPAILKAVHEIILNLMSALTDALPGIIATIVAIVPDLIIGLTSFIPQLLQAGIDLLMALVDALPVVIPALIDALPELITSFINAMNESIPILLEAAVKLFKAIVQAIPQIAALLSQNLPLIWQAIKSGLAVLPTRLWKEILQPAINKVVEWAADFIEKAKTAASDFLSNVIEVLASLPAQIAVFLTSIINNVTTWGSNLASKARNAASRAFNAVVSGLSGLPARIKTIGRDLVTGLWNGITDKFDWLVTQIESFATNIKDKLKNFFGIESPSKETAWMGRMLDEGLAKGVLDYEGLPLAAIRRVSGNILGAAASDLNGLTLDRQLQTTFGPPPGAGSADTGLMAKLDNIIDAIEKGKLLLLDGDRLVGATAGRYDKALGKRQVLAERGAL